jgi:hypothetical protein
MPRKEKRLFYRHLGLSSFYHFVKIFGTPVRQGGDISPIVHRQLCDFSQDPTKKRKGIAMGRNLRKTTTFLRWKAIWCYLRDNEERILIGSEIKETASANLIWIKDMIAANQLLRWCFPELCVMDQAYKYRHRFSNTFVQFPRQGSWSEPTFTAIGVGGAGQGKHYSRLLLTDILGERGMLSPTVMEKTMLWIDNIQELLDEPDLSAPNTGEIQLDFTHWKVGDAYEYMQDKYPAYEWRIVPALKCDDETLERGRRGHKNIVYVQNPHQDIGETNYPDIVDEELGLQRFSTAHYRALLGNPESERVFWTQHMNMPHMAESGNNTFKHEWIRYFRWEERVISGEMQKCIVCAGDKAGSVEVYPLRGIRLIGVIDPGGFAEKSLKAGRCAFIIAGQPVGTPKKFIVKTWSKRVITPSALMDAVFGANDEFRNVTWRIETIAAQNYIYKDIREERERRKKQITIVPLDKDQAALTSNAKDLRVQGLIAPVSNGEYYLHEGTAQDLVGEIVSYPGITRDLIDCMSIYNLIYGTGLKKGATDDLNKKRYQDWVRARTT